MQAEEGGDHVRRLASPSAVRGLISAIISTKNATSEIGQELGTATKRASNAGVNVPAARIAARIVSKARQDALVARTLWEDISYYLLECSDFERIAPPGMFSAEEGGQRRPHMRQPENMFVEVEERAPTMTAETVAEPMPEPVH